MCSVCSLYRHSTDFDDDEMMMMMMMMNVMQLTGQYVGSATVVGRR